MKEYYWQTERIKAKLKKARLIDKDFEVFGADSHEYVVRKKLKAREIKAIEIEYNILLPSAFKAFLMNIGSCGISFRNSAAGPGYGIFPITEDKNVKHICSEYTQYLNDGSLISADMSDEYWKNLTAELNYYNNYDEDSNEPEPALTDEQAEKEYARIFSGILPLGTEGCTSLNGLVLNGKHKGQVISFDEQFLWLCKPVFSIHKNFLDYYEYWLDRIVLNSREIIDKYKKAETAEQKRNCIYLFYPKKQLGRQALSFLAEEYKNNSTGNIKKSILELLVKYDYNTAKPYLDEVSKTMEVDDFTKLVKVFAPEKYYIDWLPYIKQNLTAENTKLFSLFLGIMEDMKTDYSGIILPFVKHKNPEIRSRAYYSLSLLKNYQQYTHVFIDGVKDNDSKVLYNLYSILRKLKLKDKNTIVSFLSHNNKYIRLAGVFLAKNLGEKEKTALLTNMLNDNSEMVVRWAKSEIEK